MSERIPFQSIYINSTPGTNGIMGTGSSFTVFLRGSPIIPRAGRLVKAAVTTATIPLTYYGINSTNNVLEVTEDDGTLPKTFDVTLIPGQYSSASVMTMINVAMGLASVAGGYGLTYTSTLSTDTGRITFSSSSGTILAPYTVTLVTAAPTDTTAYVPLGLSSSGANPSFIAPYDATDPTTYYIAPNIINIIGPTELHIRSGNFIANIYESRVQSESPILAIIPIVANQFESAIYIPAEPKLYGIVGSRLDKLDFYITDENGIIVDLNNFGAKIQLALYDTAAQS